jgi:hypothetical protein
MAINIRDEHLETLVNEERIRRGDATMAKTLGDVARERLMQLEMRQEKREAKADLAPASMPVTA